MYLTVLPVALTRHGKYTRRPDLATRYHETVTAVDEAAQADLIVSLIYPEIGTTEYDAICTLYYCARALVRCLNER